MGRLIYAAITSLDGFVADANGDFGWAAPDEEVHGFVNDLERSIGTYLYGRKIYEVMRYWETAPVDDSVGSIERDYTEVWRSADKVVYSTTLESVSTERTRLEPTFDPVAVGRLKVEAEQDLSIGGPHLAAEALRAGLVDECHVFLCPVIMGSGNHWLPDDVRVPLELLDERRFASGVVHLHHRIAT